MNKYTNIHIHSLSSSTQQDEYLLSYNGIYYAANYSIVELLEELQQSATLEEAIKSYINRKKGRYTPVQVKQIIDKYITPFFATHKRDNSTFLYKKELFPATTIDQFSNTLSFLFNNIYIWSVIVLAFILDCCFFFSINDLLALDYKVSIYTIIGLFLFMLTSSFFHELGHASACKHFGIKHGGIGFGLYLNFPVLYTDVTEVWKLDRKKRCIVNIAGIYFQSFCLIGLLIGFFWTGNGMLRYMILIMNLGFLMTLNPFFKFDGYWVASDILGVPNLRARSTELISYLYKCIRKQPVFTKPYLLQIRTTEKIGLAIYSIVVNLFMGYYFLFIIPTFIYNFVHSFPEEVEQLIMYLSNNITPPFALIRNIGLEVLFFGLMVYFLTKTLHPIVKRCLNHA
nr:hypothetical protein [uncultured Bacteroides sp.]